MFLIVEALDWIAQIRGKRNIYITLFIGEGAQRVRHSLSGVYKFKLVRYMYIYIYVCMHNSCACHVYDVMWVDLGHSHILYVPAVSNVVTNESSLLSTALLYCSESKPILYLDTVYCKFLFVEIDPFSCKQTSAI